MTLKEHHVLLLQLLDDSLHRFHKQMLLVPGSLGVHSVPFPANLIKFGSDECVPSFVTMSCMRACDFTLNWRGKRDIHGPW